MTFPDRVRLPFAFDAAQLRHDLAVAEGAGWYNHVVRQNYEGTWDVIALRAAVGETHPVRQIVPPPGATEFADLPLLQACPAFGQVVARLACPVSSVRLMRLTPGSVIKEHCDPDLGIEDGFARLHVPVLTNDDVDFRLNGRRVDMEAGSAWYLRLSDPHAVKNRGTTDRVHLVIDVVANDWLRAQLRRAVSASAADSAPQS